MITGMAHRLRLHRRLQARRAAPAHRLPARRTQTPIRRSLPHLSHHLLLRVRLRRRHLRLVRRRLVPNLHLHRHRAPPPPPRHRLLMIIVDVVVGEEGDTTGDAEVTIATAAVSRVTGSR